MIYLDEAATTPLRRDVLAAMGPYLGPAFGNPSSHHELGEAARAGLEQARADVAVSLGARPGEVTFTSGGTESANTAVKGICLAQPRGRHVVVSAVEHPAVLESALWLGRIGYDVTLLDVDEHGAVDPGVLAAALRDDTTLVSVQHANNEVGTVQPVADLAAVAAERGVPFHTDAVQSAAWLDVDVTRLNVQALSLSAHKLGGPKGAGVLWVRRGTRFEPLVHGGGQQDGRRSGTEDVPGAVGLAAALRLARGGPSTAEEVAARRDRFVAAVLAGVPGARLTGHPTSRLPGHASFVLPGRSGESVLLDLERRGIVCSSGSACHAGSDEPSHVLTAMGLEREVAQTALRFTFGVAVTDHQLAETADALVDVVG
ncbi:MULTISPECIES: cysteine desulfurase family protein [unclassified Aeromicrobium]|uniref:cysteine desulfurase family protein n=1 Tax=unclassified Aeromicrobium TaxID=2633570 RepID=UPI0006F65C11|nr:MULTISPECIES: cysteine desulfurase family protein [unclassified Aeromicrobium]KQP25734.1 cysteine desulfurase [Aeromicrobium sp. Leaf272]KQP80186.1 cysteine desulfurase [Aeromicrobium sp. Leaf289]KQP82494.1 cysteine desulfurase [Aeromicrobium sp. Leaf291]